MNNNNDPIKVALADDHVLIRKGLALMINDFDNCKVIFQASNGKELITQISAGHIPDVVILDQNMPEMDGVATASWLYANHPLAGIIMLTQYDTELFMIRLLQVGVKGFLRKDIEPAELKLAIEACFKGRFYYSESGGSPKLINLFRDPGKAGYWLKKAEFSDTAIEFLKLSAKDMSYKEMMPLLDLDEHSIETLRKSLFEKFDVKSRVGLVVVAARHGIIVF